MFLGRVLIEGFQNDVLAWLRERVEIVVVNPWAERDRWDAAASGVDATISRKGRISREHMEKSGGRLKIIARTRVGVDPSRVDLDTARKISVTNMPGSKAVSVAELVFGRMIALVRHTPPNRTSSRFIVRYWETKSIIGEKELASTKRSACLINAARGGIIDEIFA